MKAKSDEKSANKMDARNQDKKTPEPEKKSDFVDLVGLKAARKLHARRNSNPGIWFGLGMMGIVGWSVVIPTLLGAALGIWLDNHYADKHSWTLALLIAGLTLGCFNAWYWVDKEQQAMRDEQEQEKKHNHNGE